jgi:hypothetical protein
VLRVGAQRGLPCLYSCGLICRLIWCCSACIPLHTITTGASLRSAFPVARCWYLQLRASYAWFAVPQLEVPAPAAGDVVHQAHALRRACKYHLYHFRIGLNSYNLLCLLLQLLGEVVQPGDRILVAKGGKGGMGVRAPSRGQKQRDLQREMRAAQVSATPLPGAAPAVLHGVVDGSDLAGLLSCWRDAAACYSYNNCCWQEYAGELSA